MKKIVVSSDEAIYVAEGKKKIAISRAGTHNRPHFDEVLGYWLFTKYGHEKYNIPEDFRLDVVDDLLFGNKFISEPGIVFLGIGGGKFDEHSLEGEPRKEGECCATLVAKDLGVEKLPELYQLLGYAKEVDLNGTKDIMSIPVVMKNMYDLGYKLEDVIGWCLHAIEVKYADQKNFLQAVTEFDKLIEKPGAVLKIVANNGKLVQIAVIESENGYMAKASRYRKFDLLIQKKPTGNVIITSNTNGNLDLRDLVRLLRQEEAVIRKIKIDQDWKTQEAESLVNMPYWYFHKGTNSIMNGSDSTPVESTAIKFDAIVKIARFVFAKNTCEGCGGDKCGDYRFGLMSCRRIRHEQIRRN